jgi:hypothetical protein
MQGSADLYTQLIATLCETLGMQVPPVLDGAFHLRADELEIDILREAGGQTLVIQCRVATLGEDPGLELLGDICEANFRWCATGGATLSLHKGTGEVHLAREYPLQALDMQQFQTLLERFIDAADFWRRRIGGIAMAAPAAEASVPDYFVRI